MTWILPLFLVSDLFVDDVAGHAARVHTAMQASLAAQRASVERQVKAAGKLATWPTPGPARALATVARPAPPPTVLCEPVPQPDLARMIQSAAEDQGLDPAVIREVARQESGFRPCAVSVAGAEGLMQLMPSTQAGFQVSDPFDPRESIDAGSRLLKQLLTRYHGDLARALGAYNAGPARVDEAGDVPEIPETQNYVREILLRLWPPR